MQADLKTLNIGILGVGEFSESSIRNFIDRKMFGLCCGLHSNPYDELIKLRSFDELDKAVDAVLVMGEDYCLYENLVEIIKSCKHLFIRHAHHLSKHQLKKLANLACEAGVKVHISNGQKFTKVHDDIKEKAVEPHIIECSHYRKRAGDDEAFSIIEHALLPDIDVVLSLAKSRVRGVSATGVGVICDDPDVVNARIEFYNGCVATISASKIADKQVHKIRFFQNNHYYTINYQDHSLRVVKNNDGSTEISGEHKTDQIEDETMYHEMVNQQEILDKEIESFYYCIVLGTEPICPIDDFIEARSVADRVLDQLERNFRRK
ncbi:MAG: hypothetical protein ACI8ZN_000891 [Bacteroidia bacterium]|jgi:hypothetical protein